MAFSDYMQNEPSAECYAKMMRLSREKENKKQTLFNNNSLEVADLFIGNQLKP